MIEWQYIVGHGQGDPTNSPTWWRSVHGTLEADTLPEATCYAINRHRRRFGCEPTDIRVWVVR